MSFTLPEICERLRELDEITLMEILNVNSEMLVEAFMDKIEEEADRLEALVDGSESIQD